MRSVERQIDVLIQQARTATSVGERNKVILSAEEMINLHASALSGRAVASYLRTLQSLRNDPQERDVVSEPKTFGFRRQWLSSKKVPSTTTTPTSVEENSNVGNGEDSHSLYHIISDRMDEVVVLDDDKQCCRGLQLNNFVRCTVYIKATNVPCLMACSLTDCSLISKPVRTSVYLDGCTGSTVAISCQQIRIKSCSKLTIFASVMSATAVIEDSSDIAFGPYTVDCEKDVDLDNFKQQVDDFSCPSSDDASPNWRLLRVDELRTFSLTHAID